MYMYINIGGHVGFFDISKLRIVNIKGNAFVGAFVEVKFKFP